MSAKKKSAPACTPQTWKEADALMAEYGRLCGQEMRLKAGCEDALAKVKVTFQDQLAPLQARMDEIESALECYASANRKALTDDGKTKTVTMTAGAFGWRNSPPSVAFRKGLKAGDIVAAIKALAKGYTAVCRTERSIAQIILGFIRTKEEPDKEAMLRNVELAAKVDGVKIVSGAEAFFVESAISELPEAK